MNIKTLENEWLLEFQQGVDSVLFGKKTDFTCKLAHPVHLVKYLQKKGIEGQEPEDRNEEKPVTNGRYSFDTNGWEYDWNMCIVTVEGDKFVAFGSGYYGQFTIEKDENED